MLSKALVASQMIEPSNVVQYIIIKDHSRRGHDDDPADEEEWDVTNEEDTFLL